MGELRMVFDDRGFSRRMAGARQVVMAELETAVKRTTLEGSNRSKGIVRAKGRIDVSRLLNSLTPGPVRRLGNAVRGQWGTNVRYGEVIEKGRGAGKPPPPTAAILPWMRRHGIPEEFAYVVARKIGIRGIPGIWFLRDARRQVEPLFAREVGAAATRAIRRLNGGR